MENANRGVFRGQITKLTKSAIDYLNSPESQVKEENAEHFDEAVEELTAMLSRLTAAHDNLRKANENVRPLVKAEDFEKECEAIMEYDDKAINCVSRIKCRLERIIVIRDKILSPSNLQVPPMEKQRAVKLPKLDLKKFSGDYKEWLPFWEQYKTLIHENNNLSVSDKFNYLQSALYGKAAASIAGFPPNKECYDAAIALLQEEYGDTEKLVEKHMQQLMTLSPVVSRHDAGGLRRLYNTVVTNTRTLTTLGVSSNNYYVMLKSILLKCIPSDLRMEFYTTSSVVEKTISADSKDHAVGDDDAHSLSSVATSGSISLDIDSGVKHLLKFIKREVESIEKAGSTVKSSNTYSSSNVKLVKTAAGLLVSSEGKQFCIFCKSSGHFTDRCDGKQTLSERKDILKRNGRCFKCTRKGHTSKNCTTRNIRCSKCTGRHVPSMCDPHFSRRSDAVCQKESTDQLSTNLYSSTAHFPTVYLQTACAYMSALTNKVDSSILVRILLDSGSQLSYIRKNVAEKLNLAIVDTVKIRILPFGCAETTPMMSCDRVKVLLRSIHDDKVVIITAVVVPEICLDTLPVPDISKPEFSKYILADSRQFGSPEEGISLLIGSDFYWNVVSGEFERIKANLTAVKTNLGWIIQGPEAEQQDNIFDPVTLSVALCDTEEQFSTDVQRLWDLESLGITNFDLNTNLITEHCVRRKGNRYEASLLWQDIDSPLSNYREGAYQRFNNLVRRLSREPKKLMEYDEAMNDIIQAGFAEIVKNETSHENRIYYMPHRPVYREDKSTTKLRVVFDASAHATGCRSLNDHLDAGPNLLPDILSVLLRFRLRKIALVADVEKAFLQIILASKDRDVHRFFWFSERLKHAGDLPAFQEYRMTRVTFGVKCSPFLLGAVLQQHLKEESNMYPEICEILRKAFYMDDLFLSIDDEELAESIYSTTCALMKRASFNIRKWNSNNLSLRAKMKKDADPPNKQKVLGAIWYCLSDEIAVDLDHVHEFISSIVTVTKRTVLQLIARIFDPLGMLSPFIIKLKILFQDLWRLKLSWDDVIPKEFMTIWNKCCVEFQCLQYIFLPRCIKDLDEPHTCQLHIFADASPSAYGAVAYMRLQSNNEVRIKYICSKNRVAPLKGGGDKQLTLPKLELTAALIAARLRKYIEKTLQLKWEKVNLWTDSKITLCWINGDIRRWNSYVSGRVNEIREHCLLDEWRHCPGEHNPADFLTRGVPGKNLANSEVWIEGPSWLSKDDKDWPQPSAETEIDPKSHIFLQIASEVGVEFNHEALFDFTKFSSYVRILRITAYIRRFINKTRNSDGPNNRFLVGKELEIAEEFWIHYIQRKYYYSELKALTAGKPVPAHSSILSLNPILDEKKILRVGSRLKYLNNNYDSCFSIILPKSNHLTMLIVRDAHERLLHGGVNAVLCRLRERFWVPRARQLIKGITKKCNICRRMFGKPANQPFAPLPRNRLSSSRPFETTGVDFAGPLYVRISSDDTSTRKVYIMLLTCSAVRAVHVEMVPNMTVEYCLLALRRFIARRGVPKTMISDNARTSVKGN